jgi:hypothetical protein
VRIDENKDDVAPLILTALLLLLTALTSARGQAPSANEVAHQPDQAASLINVTTRLVYVNVVVRDARGQLVRTLTQRDFKVEKDGRTQKIDFFVAHGEDQEAPAKAAPRAVAY